MHSLRRMSLALIVAGISAQAQVFEGLDLTPKKPKKTAVSVQLTAPVSGAQLFIDGEEAGVLPLSEKVVKPGPHTLKVVRPGFATLEMKVTVAGGRKNDFELTLQATAAVLTVRSTTEGLGCSIDGAPAEPLPLTKVVEPGKHTLVVAGPGVRSETREVELQAGVDADEAFEPAAVSDAPVAANLEPGDQTDSDLDAELSRKRSTSAADGQPFFSRWYVWAGIAAVVVGGAVATGVVVSSQPKTADPTTVCGGPCSATIGFPAAAR